VKKLVLMTAALVAAVAVWIAFTIPPRPIPLAAPTDGTIPGILHIHTGRSDGLSGPDEIAAAAARAGLKFLVFTDHGDATRKPDPPQYRAGVLCLDGVEISTSGGHYIAIDMPASPYPLAGEARDVVEDVRRLGGFGIAAHPDSPKPELRWGDWRAPIDGVELLNPDTGWRLWAQQANGNSERWSARRRLLAALFDYPFRPAPVIASLIWPSGAIPDWEALTARRRLVAIAGVDAHAKIAPRSADPGDSRYALPFPGYESSFRVMSIHVKPDRPFSGDAAADARVLMRAIRSGHLYTAVDGAATPASFEFTATNEHGTVNEGDEIGVGGPVTLRVRSNAPPSFTTIIWKDGGQVFSTDHHDQDFTVQAPPEPAVYWAEIRATGRPNQVAWVRSNPIYIRSPEAVEPAAGHPPATQSVAIFDGTASGWRVEHDPLSVAAVERAPSVDGAELRLRYGLAGGASVGQVVALAFDTPAGVAGYDRLSFSIRAEHPMRISVQLRAGDDQGPASRERWKRTVYVDTSTQDRTVFFDDLIPVGETHTAKPIAGGIRTILFVIDATNTKLGDSARIWIRKAALER
jgi:hypothetical protein